MIDAQANQFKVEHATNQAQYEQIERLGKLVRLQADQISKIASLLADHDIAPNSQAATLQ